MIVRSSHLALRFYIKDGWSESVLRSCLVSGSLFYHDDSKYGRNPDMSYWTLDHTTNARFDTHKLSTFVSKVYDYRLKELTGSEAIKYMSEQNL